jgi:indolepyruvate ferredoxin oxidoreductase beta subunit
VCSLGKKTEKEMKKDKNFNLIICGVGGQGQITLLRVLSQAALIEKKNFRAAETHGLSQRGGAVEVHFRMGKVYSPLICQAEANLVLSLEFQETLRALYYSNKDTKFLINDKIIPIPGEKPLKKENILKEVKNFSKNIEIIEASKICQEKLGSEILAGIFLISLGCYKKLIPIKTHSLAKSIKEIIPKKYLELNLKSFKLAKNYT